MAPSPTPRAASPQLLQSPDFPRFEAEARPRAAFHVLGIDQRELSLLRSSPPTCGA
ncbi:MAG: hypothetical protein IPH72_32650 [Sandaracinaceae bacterium]|nr:hypothetical protein [Sandaracinaceae bacterium]